MRKKIVIHTNHKSKYSRTTFRFLSPATSQVISDLKKKNSNRMWFGPLKEETKKKNIGLKK